MNTRQSGVTLIEVLVVLAIGAMMLAGLSSLISNSVDDVKGQQAAAHQAEAVAAAKLYINTNYSTLLALPVNTTKSYTVAVFGVNNLPPGFVDANIYGQTTCLLVRPRVKITPLKSWIVIDAALVTEGPATLAIPERDLAYIAGQAGPGAGYLSSRNVNEARGVSGAWVLNAGTTPSLANFQGTKCSANAVAAGSLISTLFFDGPGQQSSDFLYRNKVPGYPELNQMNAPVSFGAGAVVVAGDTCGTLAAIGVDGNRNLMSCFSDGKWARTASSTWKDPVADFSALSALSTTDNPGDVRLVAGSVNLAFTLSAGRNWVPLAADQNGNLTVKNLTVTNNATVMNNLAVTNNATAGGTVTGQYVTATKDVKAGVNLVADANVYAKGFEGDYVWMADYVAGASLQAYSAEKFLGDKCHEKHWNATTGIYDYWWAIGTMMLENPWGKSGTAAYPTMMVCSGTNETNARFVYMNGAFTRDYQ